MKRRTTSAVPPFNPNRLFVHLNSAGYPGMIEKATKDGHLQISHNITTWVTLQFLHQREREQWFNKNYPIKMKLRRRVL